MEAAKIEHLVGWEVWHLVPWTGLEWQQANLWRVLWNGEMAFGLLSRDGVKDDTGADSFSNGILRKNHMHVGGDGRSFSALVGSFMIYNGQMVIGILLKGWPLHPLVPFFNSYLLVCLHSSFSISMHGHTPESSSLGLSRHGPAMLQTLPKRLTEMFPSLPGA